MSLKKNNRGNNILAFVIALLAILVQGSYFTMQFVVLIILLVLLLISNRIHHNVVIDKYYFSIFIVLFLSYFIPALTMDADLNKIALESLRWLCFGIPLLICWDELRNKMLVGAYAGITILSLLGVLAYIKILNFNEWAAMVDGVFRMQSTIGYANVTAVLSGAGVILAYLFRLKSKDYKFFHSIFLSINLLGMVLTLSRFGMICFMIAVIVMLSMKYKKMMYISLAGLVFSIGGIITIFLLGKEASLLGSTLVGRLIYWQDGLLLWLKHPLGIGAGQWEIKQYGIQSTGYYVKFVHNSLLQISIDGGIMALVSLVLLMLIGFVSLYNIWRSTKDDFYLGLMGLQVLIVLHSIVDIDLSYSAIIFVLGIVTGFGAKPHIVIKKGVLIPIGALLITATLFVGINTAQSRTKDDYQSLLINQANHPNDVIVISKLFNISYAESNSKEMYKWSKKWVELAPRQQNAYDAHLVSLNKMVSETNDNKYVQEKNMLYEKAEAINQTANPLTRYYDSYKNIILPKMK